MGIPAFLDTEYSFTAAAEMPTQGGAARTHGAHACADTFHLLFAPKRGLFPRSAHSE